MGRYSSIALVIVTGLAAGASIVSCSSDDEPVEGPGDAGQESSTTPDVEVPEIDAGAPDAPIGSLRDAAPYDGGPLPIVCTTPPCATSLTTTRSPAASELREGYCALLDDGTVACWGSNGYGQLGRGDDAGTNDSATAARVVGLSDVTQLDHTCAVDKQGGVWCWGTGAFLRNDAGASTTERTPIKLALPPAKRIATGLDVTCALVDDDVLCWGRNSNALIVPLGVAGSFATLPATPIAVPPGAPIRTLLVGSAAFAVREDGVTLTWGANPPLARISSMAPDPNPLAISLEDISSLDVTTDSACATVLGIGYCWGRAVSPPNVFDRVLPEPVATPEPIVQIATTSAIQLRSSLGDLVKKPQRWCAVGASGTVYCWGYNEGGQAGDGTQQHAYDAVKVKGLPAPAVEVRALPDSTCALLTNGKIHCWGTNYYGQLGNGQMRIPSLVPQEVVLP